ncbi:forespore capture DNA-binding protein RefZ [Texcoconibacillus texcoconensis]|uniref:AcrR family transcriptional regulator n=1 Tax=Texcoconibacillus texcoconensis TaxID=1095777 RepID=A0A840QMZ5_9BACI|nr:forespore capture DNA-binding protein RefZ [Texcoconibacillus texcoconensis]MBB5172762.1 AcrR family transcriptional regulator [Texcoconibacillus texcoconensis]
MEATRTKKERVWNAAIELFNVYGYTGTTVRDIAERANTNVALISYYFGSKQGLLEQLMASFFEGYIETLESTVFELNSEETSFNRLLKAVYNILDYQKKRHNLARFVHREITLDSTLVRELMSTYLMKERHLYQMLLDEGGESGEIIEVGDYFVLQLRGMIIMPFLHPQYIREVYHLMPHEDDFVDTYFQELKKWLLSMTKKHLPT